MKKIFFRRALFLAVVVAAGCVPPPSALPRYDSTRPAEFKQAVEILSKVLVSQYETYLSKNILSRVKKAKVAIEPFVVQGSADDSEAINGLISGTLLRHLAGNKYFETVAPEYANRAEYLVRGEVALKSSPANEASYYLLSGTIVEKRTGAIVGSSSLKVSPVFPAPVPVVEHQPNQPYGFDEGMNLVSKVLINHFDAYRYANNRLLPGVGEKAALLPFVVKDAADGTQDVNARIREILSLSLASRMDFVDVAAENSGRPDYFIKGTVAFENNPRGGADNYHLSTSILEKKTGQVVSSADVWMLPQYPPPSPVAAYDKSKPYDFNEGMNILSKELLNQYEAHHFKNNRLLPLRKTTDDRKMTAMDPFVVQDTGDVLKVNHIIENIFTQNLAKSLNLTKTNRSNGDQIEYIIIGMIALEKNPTVGNAKTYHVYATLYEKTSGTIVSSGDVWVSSIDYSPLELYKDSPVYIRSTDLENLSRSVKTKVGDAVDKSLLRSQDSKALFAEADALYEKREYGKALPVYLEIEKRDDGKSIKVYAVLYNISFLTGDYGQAEYYFARLMETCIAEKGNIEVKLLFKVQTTDYVSSIRGRDTAVEYDLWMRQIGTYLEAHPRYCLSIAGHASRTGTDEYNVSLSKKRALAVQQHLRKYNAEIVSKSRTVGMGYRENIIGTASDDDSDSIDRRVEFSLIDCKAL